MFTVYILVHLLAVWPKVVKLFHMRLFLINFGLLTLSDIHLSFFEIQAELANLLNLPNFLAKYGKFFQNALNLY